MPPCAACYCCCWLPTCLFHLLPMLVQHHPRCWGQQRQQRQVKLVLPHTVQAFSCGDTHTAGRHFSCCLQAFQPAAVTFRGPWVCRTVAPQLLGADASVIRLPAPNADKAAWKAYGAAAAATCPACCQVVLPRSECAALPISTGLLFSNQPVVSRTATYYLQKSANKRVYVGYTSQSK